MLTIDEGWDRARPTPLQQRNDVLLAAGLMVFALFSTELMHSVQSDVDMGWRGIGGYLLSVGGVAVLAVRRRYPVAVLVASSAFFYVLGEQSATLSASVAVQVGVFIAFYSAWAWSRHRLRLAVVSAVVVVGMFVWVGALLVTNQDMPEAPADSPGLFSPGFSIVVITLIINVGYFFGAIAWGIVSWRSARQRQELLEQAEELRREQELSAQRAVADERLRIARDLHDVVAHHVSGIGIQAAGARRLLERDPDASREALGTIERSSRSAVQEMHRLVSLLRTDDGDDREPQPGLGDLGTLTARTGDAGLEVRYREVGHPFEVPSTVSLSLYRTVQEALSNVRQHSTARGADVVVRWIDGDEGAVEVEVLDDGRPRTAPTSVRRGVEGGFGLRGIRERAALHDGSHEIGPRPQGGFRVRVRVPVSEERA
ncbi:histidine kinase [Solicola sp. PLA-1-18]|uniref:histidine kinase n=1 Tax=Solicola sp. PLA-1-18 TaxID=3380532 RepID=UPI003B7A51C5